MGSQIEWTITKMEESVEVDSFNCGDSSIDEWFKSEAIRYQTGGTTAVYVCLDLAGKVIAFFTLSSHVLQKRGLPEQSKDDLAGSNIPVFLLGRLGVCSDYQRQGLGRRLVEEAKALAATASSICAARFLYVQAQNDGLIEWYKGQGFVSMPKTPRNMVFDLKTTRREC